MHQVRWGTARTSYVDSDVARLWNRSVLVLLLHCDSFGMRSDPLACASMQCLGPSVTPHFFGPIVSVVAQAFRTSRAQALPFSQSESTLLEVALMVLITPRRIQQISSIGREVCTLACMFVPTWVFSEVGVAGCTNNRNPSISHVTPTSVTSHPAVHMKHSCRR